VGFPSWPRHAPFRLVSGMTTATAPVRRPEASSALVAFIAANKAFQAHVPACPRCRSGNLRMGDLRTGCREGNELISEVMRLHPAAYPSPL
jgi:hypothetical protein